MEKIRRIFAKSLAIYGELNHEDTFNLIKLEKEQIIKQTQILDYVNSDASFDKIGGLKNLKKLD